MRNRSWSVACLWLAIGLLAGAARAEVEHERWFVLQIQGQKAGYSVERTIREGEHVISESELALKIRRGQIPVEMTMTSRFIETADGRPVRCVTKQRFAQMEMTTETTYDKDGVVVRSTQGDRTQEQQRPALADDVLAPGAASRYVDERLEAGEQSVTVKTLDPTAGATPFTLTVRRIGKATIDVFGKRVPAFEHRVVNSLVPGIEMTVFADDEGHMLKTIVPFGGIQMDMVAADKALATAEIDAPELLAETLVRVDFAMLRPRELRQCSYVLTVREGRMPDLPQTPVQTVKRLDDRTVRVTIDMDRPSPPDKQPPPIEHTAMIDGRDEKVIELAQSARKNTDDDPAARAEAMRRYVHRYISGKNLNVGMASASEVARTAEGDCSEHGVLLAAMLKADGIPARVASGLIYADGFLNENQIFGYHMWTQAWIDGRWVDLDATLDRKTPFDATHITLSVSDLADEQLANDMVVMAPLFGQLKIELANDE